MATSSELLGKVEDLIGRRNDTQIEFSDWVGGGPVGGPNGNGLYPMTDSSGHTRMVPSPAAIAASAKRRGPEQFGAIGDRNSHPARNYFSTLAACQEVYPFAKSLAQEMDWLAWQAMIMTEDSYTCPLAYYKMCNSDPDSMEPLDWTGQRADVDASFSELDWRDLRQKFDDRHLSDNYDFRNGNGYINAPYYDPNDIVFATFDTGAAVMIDPGDGTNPLQKNYYEWWKDFTIPVGRWTAIVEGTITRGQSFDHGNFNPAYGSIDVRGTDRNVPLALTFDPVNPTTTPVPFTGKFDFAIFNEPSNTQLVFHGGGYCNFRVTRFDIVPFVPNCAIIFNRDGDADHYFVPKRLRNAEMKGPGEDVYDPVQQKWVQNKVAAEGLIGCLWKSFRSLDGDLHEMESVRVLDFDIAVKCSDGAYLLHFWQCTLMGQRCAFLFEAGNKNAGENIKFMGGSMSAQEYIFENPGEAEITTVGVATDYPGIGLCKDNAGIIRLIGTRHEQNHPDTKPIWHCTTGQVIYIGSYILLAKLIGTASVPPAQLDTTSARIDLHGCHVYNLSSKSGIVATGAGSINFFGLVNSGNANIGFDLITEADSSDVLGGAGKFEPQRLGESVFGNIDPSGIFLTGGLFSTANDGSDIMLDQWNSESIKVSVSGDYCRTGTRSLKIEKTTGKNDNVTAELQFYVPFQAQGNMLGRMFLNFPNDMPADYVPIPDRNALTGELIYLQDGVTLAPLRGPPIYFRQFYVQVIGYDALNRPIISQRTVFKGENTIRMPLKGSGEWLKRNISTMYEPAGLSDVASPRSPAWATHVMIAIGFQSTEPVIFHIDDFQMNFLG
jgi:hypothetical protein